MLNQGGFYYVAMYGNAGVGRLNHTSLYFFDVAEVEAYQDGAPGGMMGGVAFPYSCVWRRARVRAEKVPTPRAKRTWETLSPSTRSSYRGTMKRRLLLRTEPEFKHYYETAPDLSLLRRHQTKTFVATGLGRIDFASAATNADPPSWLITWIK